MEFLSAWGTVRVILCFLFCCWRKALEQWLAWAVLPRELLGPAVSTSKAVILYLGWFCHHLGTSGNIWRCVCLSQLRDTTNINCIELRDAINHPTCAEWPWQQIIMLPQMSILPTLRNYASEPAHYQILNIYMMAQFGVAKLVGGKD